MEQPGIADIFWLVPRLQHFLNSRQMLKKQTACMTLQLRRFKTEPGKAAFAFASTTRLCHVVLCRSRGTPKIVEATCRALQASCCSARLESRLDGGRGCLSSGDSYASTSSFALSPLAEQSLRRGHGRAHSPLVKCYERLNLTSPSYSELSVVQ